MYVRFIEERRKTPGFSRGECQDQWLEMQPDDFCSRGEKCKQKETKEEIKSWQISQFT